MFCIALVLLLQCLFFGSSGGYTFRVGGSDFVQLDLFDTLHLHNSTYQGITLGIGVHTLSPGVIFTGDYREIMISGSWIDRIRSELGRIGANEFTISTIIKQNPNNVGTLLAFSRGLLSALEIQSSGRKDELRVISGSSVETFPFRLADGNWHRLAIAFSASQVDILVDCTLTYRRVLKFDPAAAISNSNNISIWIGQKTTSHFLYQGVMQDLRLTFGPYGYLAQCPQMDSQCPTCSEFTALKMSFASLQSQIQLLTERLIKAEARLTNVEQCDCQKSCRVNVTTVVDDGSSWQQDCDTCACKKGEIKCRPVQCPPVRCKNPIIKPGECCPTCLNQCFFRGKSYDHGETEAMPECAYCECMDGSMQCKKGDSKNCPPLSCPPSQQIVVPGECCKVCPGTDYCATEGHRCHSNATCVNLRTTFTCQCKEGFSGDGLTCEDMDECLLERNHCARNTRCVNTLGGYACECFNGFKKINAFQCEDHDECAPGFPNDCSPHATCTNTKGSYTCACSPGYTGSGYGAAGCTPICNSTCQNGGICIAPDVCSCRSGWTGSSCETDTDECLLMGRNISSATAAAGMGSVCPENAICVNKPGWYLCQCEDGFQANLAENGEARCQDINECEFSPCSNGLECVNTLGSYECQCPEGSADCSPGCFLKGKMENLGSSWFSQDCSNTCTCSSPNNITCQEWSQADCSLLCSLNNNNNNDNSKNNNDHDVNNSNDDNNNNVSNIKNQQCCSHCTNNIKNNNNYNYNNSTTTTVPIGMSLMQKKTKKKKTCRHQLYPDTHHQSGEMWHYQCQTCECLDGEIDCWPIDCPPVNCHNAFLPEGDCCYRCPEEESDGDRCTHWHANNTECQLIQNTIDTIESGTRVTMPHHHCISCKCQVPLCAKSVSKNDGFCVLRMEISVALMTTIVWFAVHVLLPS